MQSCILDVARNILECESQLHSESCKLLVRENASIVTKLSIVNGLDNNQMQLRYLAVTFRSCLLVVSLTP